MPVAPVRTFAEVYDCPQTALPLTFDGERPAPRSAPPALDQHGAEILAELGLPPR